MKNSCHISLILIGISLRGFKYCTIIDTIQNMSTGLSYWATYVWYSAIMLALSPRFYATRRYETVKDDFVLRGEFISENGWSIGSVGLIMRLTVRPIIHYTRQADMSRNQSWQSQHRIQSRSIFVMIFIAGVPYTSHILNFGRYLINMYMKGYEMGK